MTNCSTSTHLQIIPGPSLSKFQHPSATDYLIIPKMKKFSTMPKHNIKTRSKLLDTQQILNLTPTGQKKRNRKRNIIWFNPPFDKNIKTNIGKTFLELIDKHFPRSSKLHKIFNRNTIKVSYSCTENMSMIIKKHNKKIINNKATPTTPPCNCRKKTECPLNGNCQQPSVTYQATAKIKNKPEKLYLGLTERTMKTKKLRTQIFIQQQKICTQYSTFEICMGL